MPQGPSIWSDFKETTLKSEVLVQLVRMNFPVVQSTFYRHCTDGKCRKNEDGVYSKRMVKQYVEAEGYYRPGDGGSGEDGSISNLSVKKLEKENEKLDWSNKAAKLKHDRETGLLIEREGLYLELAARLVALDTGFKQKISMEAPKLIAAIGGDVTRALEFEDLVIGAWNELLNDFCTIDEFEVLFDDLDVPEEETE